MRILYLTGLRPHCLRGRGAGRYWTGAVARVHGSGWGAGPCVWCPSRGWNPLRSSGNIKDLGLRPGKIWSRDFLSRPFVPAAGLTPLLLLFFITTGSRPSTFQKPPLSFAQFSSWRRAQCTPVHTVSYLSVCITGNRNPTPAGRPCPLLLQLAVSVELTLLDIVYELIQTAYDLWRLALFVECF